MSCTSICCSVDGPTAQGRTSACAQDLHVTAAAAERPQALQSRAVTMADTTRSMEGSFCLSSLPLSGPQTLLEATSKMLQMHRGGQRFPEGFSGAVEPVGDFCLIQAGNHDHGNCTGKFLPLTTYKILGRDDSNSVEVPVWRYPAARWLEPGRQEDAGSSIPVRGQGGGRQPVPFILAII